MKSTILQFGEVWNTNIQSTRALDSFLERSNAYFIDKFRQTYFIEKQIHRIGSQAKYQVRPSSNYMKRYLGGTRLVRIGSYMIYTC